ncbi:MAG: CpsD/CapB family tyrosine-protein kinase [Clostridiaceae bacterium]|nr:CpsD/CapB family tyrosine-protein kinase [Clostridiaceae bacterium]
MVKESLIFFRDPKSPVSEAYRTLRTNIQFSGVDKALKIITITSSDVGEGKTTTICNLAITMALSGKKVILIDADLRKPRVHSKFMISNETGLTNILAQKKPLESVIKTASVKDLDIITSGPIPPNPSELLQSESMGNFLEDLKKKYDYILLDTPPVGMVTDAAILAAKSDGIILVVTSGKTHIDEAKRAKQLLLNVDAKILGVVLNKVNRYEKGYYQKYYRYYEDEKKASKKSRKKRRSNE